MSWLPFVDTALPVGDIIYVGGIIVLAALAIDAADKATFPSIYLEEDGEEESDVPDVTYPGDDPAKAPEGTIWKGQGPQGSKQGNFYNPNTGESWHPDLNHPQPIGPHWDYNYKGSGVKGWRVFPDGIVIPKLTIPTVIK